MTNLRITGIEPRDSKNSRSLPIRDWLNDGFLFLFLFRERGSAQ
jgi:hypothetical protein